MKNRNVSYIHIDKEELYDLYITQNLSLKTIAKLKHCSHPTILDRIKENNIPRKKVGNKKGAKYDKI